MGEEVRRQLCSVSCDAQMMPAPPSNVDIVEIVPQIVCPLFHIREMSRVVLVLPLMICKVHVWPSCHIGGQYISPGGQIMSWRTYDVMLGDMPCHIGGQDISYEGQIMSWRTCDVMLGDMPCHIGGQDISYEGQMCPCASC